MHNCSAEERCPTCVLHAKQKAAIAEDVRQMQHQLKLEHQVCARRMRAAQCVFVFVFIQFVCPTSMQ